MLPSTRPARSIARGDLLRWQPQLQRALNVQKFRLRCFALVLPSLLRLVKGVRDGCQFLGAPPETCPAAAAPC